MKFTICQRCLTSRTGDVVGQPCQTQGCGGTIEQQPEFSTLVDVLPEPMSCPRRSESPLANRTFPGPDHWQKFKSNGDRTCSYCGSLHFDDFVRLVRVAAGAPLEADYRSTVSIEPSDKGYKVYVNQPGVRNAHEGGIKFYMQHVPRTADDKIDVTPEQNMEYAESVRRSRIRFDRYLHGARRMNDATTSGKPN